MNNVTVPIGSILAYSAPPNVDLPPEFSLCDGSRVTDANSPFYNKKVPDLRGEFLRGADDMGSGARGRDKEVGRVAGSVQDEAIVDHQHAHSLGMARSGEHSHGLNKANASSSALLAGAQDTVLYCEPTSNTSGASFNLIEDGQHDHQIDGEIGSVVSTVLTGEVRPANYSVVFVIRIK